MRAKASGTSGPPIGAPEGSNVNVSDAFEAEPVPVGVVDAAAPINAPQRRHTP